MPKTIRNISLEDKKIIIRCDFNVPHDGNTVLDDTRITMSIPTIEYAIKHNAKVILMSHLGRVKEESDKEKNDLSIIIPVLEDRLNKNVKFVNVTRGKELEDAISKMDNSDVILVQNTRYEDLDNKKESSNDEDLGKYWASLADIFINDAFGTIHRSHASNVGIASHITESGIGFLIEKELNALEELNSDNKPFIVVLGGAKVSDKIGVIENIVEKADKILIGGGMAFSFLQAEGYEIGNSLLDGDSIDFCKNILDKYPTKIILPVDIKVSSEYSNNKASFEKDITEIEYNEMGLDIGTKTIKLFENYLKEAKLVLWNGPLGVYEFSKYKIGTDNILNFLADNSIKTILGGGDIVAAATKAGVADKIYHISTGGGATLEFLEGKKLPGLESIK